VILQDLFPQSKMDKDAGPSTSKSVTDFSERSFCDEDFKGEFTNALLVANRIYEKQNLLSKNPPEKN